MEKIYATKKELSAINHITGRKDGINQLLKTLIDEQGKTAMKEHEFWAALTKRLDINLTTHVISLNTQDGEVIIKEKE